MKTLLNGLKCAVFAALTMGLALGAWAENVAEVTTGGVTTEYATFTNAWAVACEVLTTGADATVKMLKDATVESALSTGMKSNGALTLDLNDHVLAYAGQEGSLVMQESGTLHVVDTATPSAVHYFTCDKTTGLWTLTNEVTDLSVKGGLLTGARNSAIYLRMNTGAHSISNVNFVGNSSTYNGGAVSTYNASIGIRITDCTFLGNVAPNNGGAVSSGNFTMTDCRVEENVASLDGGGLYVRNHGSLVRTKVVGNKAAKGGGICVTYNPGGCFPAGVMIRMADGSEKAVEEVAEGDVVATFDHEDGVKSSAAVFYVYRGTGEQSVFTLCFASGAKLDVADRHDLLLEVTRKYVTVSCDNARSYVGKRFYNYATGNWDELTGVTEAKDCDAHYSLYTRGHANCVANGMLTVPDDKDCFVNVYELDETLKADAAQLAADIAAYGLAEPADYPNVPPDDFGDYNMRYARIAIGKGLATQEDILFWNEFDYGPVAAKKAKGALKLTTSAVAAVAPSSAYLQVGEGVVVTGNVTTNEAVSNVYLDKSNNAVIDILSGATDLDIGVTLSTDTGIFGWTNETDYASSFFSDDPSYGVVYTADRELELVSCVVVIPPLVDHAVAEVYLGETKLKDEPYLIPSNMPAKVVYTAEEGYVFADGETAVTNAIDTAKNPAEILGKMPAAPLKVVARIGEVKYTDLPTAFNKVADGETITMVSDVTNLDITAATYLTLTSGKEVTFDLNGKTVYGENAIEAQTVMLEVAGDLTIVDSSEGQTGRLVANPLNPAQYEGGSYAYGNYLVYVKNGSVTVEGGTLENKGDGAVCYAFEMGEWNNGGAVTVNGGAVRARAAVARIYSFAGAPASSFAVNGGLVESTQSAGIQYFAPGSSGRASISIAGGEIRAHQYAVYAYGTDGGMTIDMTGGKVTATGGETYPAFGLYNSRPLAYPGEQTALAISGGAVAGPRLLSVWDYYAATQTTISGGTFSGQFYVYTYDKSQDDYFRRDDFCVRITGGDFSDFDVAESSDSWFYWNNQAGVLLYGGTYDKRISTGVDYKGRVAEGYDYLDNHNGTWTVVKGKVVDDVPCTKEDETAVVPVETPPETKEEVWETATNIVATATTTQAPAIVADSELTNAVQQAKGVYGENSVTKLLAGVEVVVTPKGAVADVNDEVRTITVDVTPYLTTWAEVTDGETVSTNLVGEALRGFEYSGKPMALSFNVADMAAEPMLVVHRHGETEHRYTRGDMVGEDTFAYDPESETITLLMSEFSDVVIYSDIQVGETAYANVDKYGVCTIVGTGDMWSYAAAGESALWAYRDQVVRVVVEDTVTGVGQNAFAYMKRVKDVAIGAGVTNVCEDAFFSCLNVTNLAVGANVQTVGDSAFGRCNSLTDLTFGSKAVAEACQGKAFKIVARITMNGKTPVVDAVPKVTIDGYVRVLKGCEKLGDEWETIADETNIPAKYRFFMYEYEPMP